MATTIEDRIKAAEERAAAARKRVQQLQAKKAAAEQRKLASTLKGARADDTRRKILVGALIMGKMDAEPDVAKAVRRELDAFLERADDRALFGLGEKPAQQLKAA